MATYKGGVIWASKIASHARCPRMGYLHDTLGYLPLMPKAVRYSISHTVYENLVDFLFEEIMKGSDNQDAKATVKQRTSATIDDVIFGFRDKIDEAMINAAKGGFITADNYFNRDEVKSGILLNLDRITDRLDAILNRWSCYELYWLREETLTKQKNSMEFQKDQELGVGARNDFVVFFKPKNNKMFRASNLELKSRIKKTTDDAGKVYSWDIVQTVAGYIVLEKHLDALAKMAHVPGEYAMSDSMIFFEHQTGYFPAVKVNPEMRRQALEHASKERGYSREPGKHPTRKECFEGGKCLDCWWDVACRREN